MAKPLHEAPFQDFQESHGYPFGQQPEMLPQDVLQVQPEPNPEETNHA